MMPFLRASAASTCFQPVQDFTMPYTRCIGAIQAKESSVKPLPASLIAARRNAACADAFVKPAATKYSARFSRMLRRRRGDRAYAAHPSQLPSKWLMGKGRRANNPTMNLIKSIWPEEILQVEFGRGSGI